MTTPRTRWAVAIAAAVLVIAVAVVGDYYATRGQGDAATAATLPHRATVAPTAHVVAELYSDGSWRYVEHEMPDPTHTPESTAPPTATPTPTATTTPTPVASATPTHTPSLTPAPTLTPGAWDTPTPETTPQPTVPPATPAKQCAVMVNVSLRVRAAPSTDAPIVGGLTPNTRLVLLEAQETREYLWARHAAGWSAIYDRGTGEYYVYGITGESEICSDILGWPPTPAPPEATVYHRDGPVTVLTHLTFGSIDETIAAGRVYEAAGIPWGALVIDDAPTCAKIMAAGGRCIVRHAWAGGASADCPDMALDPVESARRYMAAGTRGYVDAVRILSGGALPYRVAVANECTFDDVTAAWWGAWIAEAVRLAESWGWPPLIAPQFFAHQPLSAQWVQDAREGWLALQRTGGGVGLHAYSIVDGDGLCALDRTLIQWGNRYVTQSAHVAEWLRAAGAGGVELWYTEAAAGWGASPVDEADFACYVEYLNGRPEVAGVALWTDRNIGQMPASASLGGHLVNIAWRVVGR